MEKLLYYDDIFAELSITEWQHGSVITHSVLWSLSSLLPSLQQWTTPRSFPSSCQICKRYITVLVQANNFSGGRWM